MLQDAGSMLTYGQMFEALLRLSHARKHSTQELARVSYSSDVQAVLSKVDSIANKHNHPLVCETCKNVWKVE